MRAPLAPPRLSEPRNVDAEAQAGEAQVPEFLNARGIEIKRPDRAPTAEKIEKQKALARRSRRSGRTLSCQVIMAKFGL